MDDAQIIQAFYDRDEGAISASREAYGRYCAAIVRNILDSEEDVEEVLSDTWLRAWNAIPPQKPDNLKLYFARIARNLSYDRFRAQNRDKRGGGEMALALEELAECVSAPGQPGDALEAAELKKAVNAFLAGQPRRERSMFLLRYFYAQSAEEIAARFDIRPGAVRTNLARTRKKLKSYLIKEGFINE